MCRPPVSVPVRFQNVAAADQNRDYLIKYTERIGAMFGISDVFAASYSAAVVITPTRLWA